MSVAQTQAAKFAKAAKEAGFTWHIRDSVLSISKEFAPGDRDAFVFADMDAPGILDLAPLKGGSVWGTDGGSVGGHVALKTGRFQMNKSGSGARFLAALAKIVEG